MSVRLVSCMRKLCQHCFFSGIKTAQTLATAFHTTHRVLLVEKNSHFQASFDASHLLCTLTRSYSTCSPSLASQ